MLKPSVFAVITAVLLAACLVLATPAPRSDAFGSLPPGRGLLLDSLAVEDIAALKLRHVLDHPPYEILILGNSRPLPLSHADFGWPAGRMFNLALTGESFRSSVLMLERLAAADRLPRLAIVSFDHAELNYYGNPLWAPADARWPQAARDMAIGLTRPSIGTADVLRMAARHVATDATLFQRSFNAARVWRGLRALIEPLYGAEDGLAPMTDDGTGYRADGSRLPVLSGPGTPERPAGDRLPPPNRNVLPGYLDYDLARLAAVAARGTRVIVFETPLFPPIHAAVMADPSPVAHETRTALLALCRHHGIECHGAPPVVEESGADPWPDIAHPPPAVLVRQMTAALASEPAPGLTSPAASAPQPVGSQP